MVTVRLFASLREALDCGELVLDWQPAWSCIEDLRLALAARGGPWAEALGRGDLRCARNQQVAERQSALKDGDEIAFFPPVTGG